MSISARKEINAASRHGGIVNVKRSLVQKSNELWACYALVKCGVIEGESKAISNTSVGEAADGPNNNHRTQTTELGCFPPHPATKLHPAAPQGDIPNYTRTVLLIQSSAL